MTRVGRAGAGLLVAGLLAGAVACGPSAGGGRLCSSGSGPSVCVSQSSFDPGDAIQVDFAGGPGEPRDWIAVYPSGACNPTCPSPSTLWKYCATDTQTATDTGVTSGTVTIDSSANASSWPLAAGDWDMVYLVDDGYSPIALLTFHVNGAAPSGSSSGPGGSSSSACTKGHKGDYCDFDSDCCDNKCEGVKNECE